MEKTGGNRKGLPKTGILFLGRRRPGFDPDWGREMRTRIRSFVKVHEIDATIPFEEISDEKTLRESLDICRNAGVDALVIAQPTISDGKFAPIVGQLWRRPLALWATPEKPTGQMISSNSLVGTHVMAATLRQMRRPFEILIGDPAAEEFFESFADTIRLVATASVLGESKVGLSGYHAPGFIDLHSDPADLSRRLGPQLFHLSTNEFLQIVDSVDDGAVSADIEETLRLRLPFRGVDEGALGLQSRFYLAIKKLMQDERLWALALRCWPELPDTLGAWPYVAVSRLVSEQVAVVAEGDVDGAIGVALAVGLGHGPVYVSDWLEHDRRRVTIWHTGTPPLQLCDPPGTNGGPAIAVHFNNRKPAVIEATIRSGLESTAYRLWRRDGTYHMCAFEGMTVTPDRHLLGVNGVLESTSVDIVDWFDEMVHEGMPHHISVAPGRFAGLLKRFARLVGISWHG